MKEVIDGWLIKTGKMGWRNPPPGFEPIKERTYAICKDDTSVSAWVECGALQVLDDEDCYPGGCYSVPLSVIERISK